MESARADLAIATKTLQDFEERDRKRIREEWWAQKAAAAAAETAAKVAALTSVLGKNSKGGNKAPKLGKEAKSTASVSNLLP